MNDEDLRRGTAAGGPGERGGPTRGRRTSPSRRTKPRRRPRSRRAKQSRPSRRAWRSGAAWACACSAPWSRCPGSSSTASPVRGRSRAAPAPSPRPQAARRRLHPLRDAGRAALLRGAAARRVRGDAGLRPAPALRPALGHGLAAAPARGGRAHRRVGLGRRSAAGCTLLSGSSFFFGLAYVTVIALVHVLKVTRAERRGRIVSP